MIITRRSLLTGLIAAPLVVVAANIMPVRALLPRHRLLFWLELHGIDFLGQPLQQALPVYDRNDELWSPGIVSGSFAKVLDVRVA